jgi:hypothetical protein
LPDLLLIAALLSPRLETKIDDLKKLSKQYKVRYAPVEDTSTDFYFLQMAEIEEKFYEYEPATPVNRVGNS